MKKLGQLINCPTFWIRFLPLCAKCNLKNRKKGELYGDTNKKQFEQETVKKPNGGHTVTNGWINDGDGSCQRYDHNDYSLDAGEG